jgi:hypothetical protein
VTLVRRRTFLEATLGGLVLENVLSARVSLGFDLGVGEASVVLASEPAEGTYNDVVQISMGAGGGDGSNNVVRFTGLLKQYDRTLFPRSVTLVARGALSLAAEYRPFGQDDALTRQRAGLSGLDLRQLLGEGATATDENIVLGALERAYDAAPPGIELNIGLIGGTGTNLGTLPPEATVWGTAETALAYIQRIDQSSLGYRTFESINGAIYRAQISGWPGAGTEVYTFVEGLDIFEARSTRTILELKNCARVDGFDYGLGAGYITHIAPGNNDIQGYSTDNPQEVHFSTSLAGRILSSSTSGLGFSCEEIADYLLTEWNRELVRVTLTTPRDDVIGPGQTHMVKANVAITYDDAGVTTNAGGTLDRLHVGEKLWVQRVDISVDASGFSQTMTYLGGGTANGYDSPIDWETE